MQTVLPSTPSEVGPRNVGPELSLRLALTSVFFCLPVCLYTKQLPAPCPGVSGFCLLALWGPEGTCNWEFQESVLGSK